MGSGRPVRTSMRGIVAIVRAMRSWAVIRRLTPYLSTIISSVIGVAFLFGGFGVAGPVREAVAAVRAAVAHGDSAGFDGLRAPGARPRRHDASPSVSRRAKVSRSRTT